MRRLPRYLCLAAILPILVLAARWATISPSVAAAPKDIKAGPSFEKDVAPLIGKYCGECHNDKKKKGDLVLSLYKTSNDVAKAQKVWEKVGDNLRSGDMPPPGSRQPSPDELDRINAWIDAEVFKIDCSKKDPGRVTLRRLNRAEYNNTIRDLVGVTF